MLNFKEIREGLGASQFDMAVKARISVAYICAIENGKVNLAKLQGRVRRGLAKAYGFDPVTEQPVPTETPEPASSATS